MTDLLVSFCGPGAPGAILARVHFESAVVTWVTMPESLPGGAAGMGLCRCEGGYSAAYMGFPEDTEVSGLLTFAEDLTPTGIARFRRIKQAHSLARFAGGFLVNSSGTDSVVRLSGVGEDYCEETHWAHGDGSHEVHVNSLLVAGRNIYVTMFGPRTDGGWYDTCGGSVWNLSTRTKVCSGLSHPHSLFLLNGRLCVLESFHGRVLDISDGGPCELFRVEGYIRGAVQNGEHLYLGTSFVRLRSKHTGKSRRESKIRSKCGIYRINLQSGQTERCELWEHGREIYDLLVTS
jgi:hypothetical protein